MLFVFPILYKSGFPDFFFQFSFGLRKQLIFASSRILALVADSSKLEDISVTSFPLKVVAVDSVSYGSRKFMYEGMLNIWHHFVLEGGNTRKWSSFVSSTFEGSVSCYWSYSNQHFSSSCVIPSTKIIYLKFIRVSKRICPFAFCRKTDIFMNKFDSFSEFNSTNWLVIVMYLVIFSRLWISFNFWGKKK